MYATIVPKCPYIGTLELQFEVNKKVQMKPLRSSKLLLFGVRVRTTSQDLKAGSIKQVLLSRFWGGVGVPSLKYYKVFEIQPRAQIQLQINVMLNFDVLESAFKTYKMVPLKPSHFFELLRDTEIFRTT